MRLSKIRFILTIGPALFAIAMVSTESVAQVAGPLDRVAEQPQRQNSPATNERYAGPLDRQYSKVQTRSTSASLNNGPLSRLGTTARQTTSVRSRQSMTSTPTNRPTISRDSFQAYGFREFPLSQSTQVTPAKPALSDSSATDVKPLPPMDGTIAQTNYSGFDAAERPRFEGSLQQREAIERPAYDDAPTTVGSSARILNPAQTGAATFGSFQKVRHVQEPAIETAPQSAVEFSGTFEDFQAMTAAQARSSSGLPSAPMHDDLDRYVPSPIDYQRHGIVGYDDTIGSVDPTYIDGASFGYDRNRLYHPLEGPTTNLLGMPTVPSGFGGSFCDEWEDFCQCKDLCGTSCGCGGLKANPGHLGLKWLGSGEACDQTEGCGCRGCQRGPKRASGCQSDCGCNN
ncbi:MAG: hypothetical protein AAFN77_18615 [Planctomycetota bacterium]